MHRYNNVSDDQLVAIILEGDLDASVYLLGTLCAPGLKYLAHHKHHAVGLDFQEVVSELYLILRKNDWKALRAFRGQNQAGRSCSLKNYIYCIAARMLARRSTNNARERSQTVSLAEVHPDHMPQTIETPAMAADDVMTALLQLPDAVDRAVIMLYKLEGLPVDEVARRLNTSTGNIYTRCSRALQVLRASLQEEQPA